MLLFVSVPVRAPTPQLSVLNMSALLVKWESLSHGYARGVITGFRVMYRKHNDETTETVLEAGGSNRELILTGKWNISVVPLIFKSNTK